MCEVFQRACGGLGLAACFWIRFASEQALGAWRGFGSQCKMPKACSKVLFGCMWTVSFTSGWVWDSIPIWALYAFCHFEEL